MIIFGQVEAGLANPYGASRDILNIHSTIGWSLAGVLALLTGCYVARQKDPANLPRGFLALDVVLAGLVITQVYLGDKLVWVYGLHTVRGGSHPSGGWCRDPLRRDRIADQRHRRLPRRQQPSLRDSAAPQPGAPHHRPVRSPSPSTWPVRSTRWRNGCSDLALPVSGFHDVGWYNLVACSGIDRGRRVLRNCWRCRCQGSILGQTAMMLWHAMASRSCW